MRIFIGDFWDSPSGFPTKTNSSNRDKVYDIPKKQINKSNQTDVPSAASLLGFYFLFTIAMPKEAATKATD